MDIAIPLHTGPLDSEISVERTSPLQVQVKNLVSPQRVFADPELMGECPKDLSVLSLVMHLGVTVNEDKRKGPPFEIVTTPKGGNTPAGNTHSSAKSTPADIERHHYCIILYGCTNKTYSCIGNNGATYETLLRRLIPLHDYPRTHKPEFVKAVKALKHSLYTQNQDW
ncbi:hypothetical protein E1B28_011009 [Marasmius oreades]|uniref:Uncharacterized protein n=1 Tax=Marasmius oreades TaxID=181124 RepID=A0A9P7URL8_9AGAR|nr:uncharacterized protein E1B28_011009 [Marasmius oreades]KAG7089314.1 hypothetical protein E1B28_011009 [Marasmius oreades]